MSTPVTIAALAAAAAVAAVVATTAPEMKRYLKIRSM
jgi:hypothetical protein